MHWELKTDHEKKSMTTSIMHDEISLLVSMTTAAGTCYISSITDRNRAQLQQANAYMISILKTFCFLCFMTCDNLFIMNTFGLSDLHFSNLINIISLFYILEESYWYDRCTAVDCNYLKTWTFSGFNKAFLDTVFALKKKKKRSTITTLTVINSVRPRF